MKTKKIILNKLKEENLYYQNNPANFNSLIQLIENHPRTFSILLNAKGRKREPNIIPKYKYLGEWVNEVTKEKLSNSFYTYPTKCYWIIYDLHDFPVCKTCHKNQEWYKSRNIHFFEGYHPNCSNQCIQDNEDTKNKRKATNNYKFGCDNPFQNEEIKKKCWSTREKNHGDKFYSNREKAKQTRMQKILSDKDYIAKQVKKREETCMLRFGYKNSIYDPEKRHKMRKKYLYDNQFFDSSDEIAYYIYNIDNKNNIVRGKAKFDYFVDGKIHSYFPDFYLPNLNQYVEIKGIQFFKYDPNIILPPYILKFDKNRIEFEIRKGKAKMECMKSHNIILIRSDSDIMKKCKTYCIKKFNSKTWYFQFKYIKK